jgi:hypothetical protein
MDHDFRYVEDRLEEQRKWHSDKATWNKNRYYVTEIIALTAGAVIPVINVFNVIPDTAVRVVSAALAALIVLASGIAKLCKFQENWLSFRALAEALEREKVLYQHAIGEYAGEQDRRDKLLVERVENTLAYTTSQFMVLHRAKDESSETPSPPSP